LSECRGTKQGLAVVLVVAVAVVWLTGGGKPVSNNAVRLVFTGYTNANGGLMAVFKVQNNQSRRIWLRGGEYMLGKPLEEPAGSWQCPEAEGISNRMTKSNPQIPFPRQYLPAEPGRNSPAPTELMVPVPSQQPTWRIGLVVEFELPALKRLQLRVHLARTEKSFTPLTMDTFMNNSTEAIWVESPVITNSSALQK
jgi:hypothetical protein